jgi:hypothetical protein
MKSAEYSVDIAELCCGVWQEVNPSQLAFEDRRISNSAGFSIEYSALSYFDLGSRAKEEQ